VNRINDPTPPIPPPGHPLVTAVIVNYNAWPDVTELVAQLAAEPEVASGHCAVVVVDNASDGLMPAWWQTPRPGVRLIVREENGGFAVGVNAGWRASRSPWVLLLNPDVVADAGLLGRVVGRVRRFEAEETEEAGVVGFGLRNPDGTRQPSVGTFPSLGRTLWEQLIPRSRRKYQAVWRTRPGTVAWVTGACMLVNSRLLAATGGLDEEFFLYYEEVALCRTARRLGWRVAYDLSIEVVHLRPLQDRPVTPRMRVITRHSKLLYFRKHLPRWQFLALCGVVAVEARVSGAWSRIRNRPEDVRSWRTISHVQRALRAGAVLGGRDVLDLADAVTRPETDAKTDAAGGPLPLGKARRAVRTPPL
jgi:N-acetylglucosaminyl-diphospho-decaprenol L-rhamnosyltransferase